MRSFSGESHSSLINREITMPRIAFGTSLLLLTMACATAPPDSTAASHATLEARDVPGTGNLRFDFNPESGVSADSVRAPAAVVWGALSQAYSRFGLGTTSHAAARVVTSQSNVRRMIGGVRLSRMLDCGSAAGSPRADNYTIALSIASRADSVGPAVTVLRTRVQASGHDISVTSHQVQCNTTGYLERQIANAVQELVR